MTCRTLCSLLAFLTLPLSDVRAQTADPDSAQALYRQISEHFQTPNVQVRIGALGPKWIAQITFDDSSFFSLPRPERLNAAQTVAEYVRDYYGQYSRLTDIVVMWSTKGSDGAIESFMRPFAVDDLGPRRRETRSQ